MKFFGDIMGDWNRSQKLPMEENNDSSIQGVSQKFSFGSAFFMGSGPISNAQVPSMKMCTDPEKISQKIMALSTPDNPCFFLASRVALGMNDKWQWRTSSSSRPTFLIALLFLDHMDSADYLIFEYQKASNLDKWNLGLELRLAVFVSEQKFALETEVDDYENIADHFILVAKGMAKFWTTELLSTELLIGIRQPNRCTCHDENIWRTWKSTSVIWSR